MNPEDFFTFHALNSNYGLLYDLQWNAKYSNEGPNIGAQTLDDIRTFEFYEQFENLKRKIESFRFLNSDWNSYGAERPNESAINNAVHALIKFKEVRVLPDSIVPSYDESIIFEIDEDDRHSLFEFYNDGGIVFLTRQGDQESSAYEIKLENISQAIKK